MSFLVEDDTLEVALAFIDACDADADTDTADTSIVLSPSVSFASFDDGDDVACVARRDDAKPNSLQVVIRSTRDNKLTAQQQLQISECSELSQQQAQTSPLTALARNTSGRAKRNASAVNRLRARKKAEALSLRNEVAELQEKLLELQHAKRAGKSMQAIMRLQREQAGKEKDAGDANSSGSSLPPKAVSIWLSIAAMQAQERFKSEALNVKLKSAVERQLHIHKALRELISKPEILE
uniref:BZIP domain-containing protein n=1 Tax=Globisporangium ultimum (strain ATCC 200006 / CBS 805.95 / DAOM BR144) TaxID=431595 RepID=K3W8R0_GLOUD